LFLRDARSGDAEALDRLLRLDKRAITDPRIAAVVARSLGRRGTIGRRTAEALRDGPRESTKPAAVKALIAAWIAEEWAMAYELHPEQVKPITNPELRGLFDAVARDTNHELVDRDLPPGEDAWRQAVTRARVLVRPVVQRILGSVTKNAAGMSG
jgi:hypothetical protein